MSKKMPSGSGLPAVWTEDMDKVICYYEAAGEHDSEQVIKILKKKFPELEDVSEG